MGVRVMLVLTDKADNPIPGVGGPLQGVTNLAYTPDGAVLDGAGYVRWDMPIASKRNAAVVPGTRVQVWENNTRVGWGVVTKRSEKISADGINCSFDCPDILFNMQKLTLTSGYQSAQGERLATTLARHMAANSRETWTAFSDLYASDGSTPYDGIPFISQQQSITGSLAKLAGERFAHYKRGIGKSVEFGTFNNKVTFSAGGPDPVTTLAVAIPNNTSQLVTLVSANNFPTSAVQYTLLVDAERMTVIGGQGTTNLTVLRGSTPVAHAAGAVATGVGVGTVIGRLVAVTGTEFKGGEATRQIDMSSWTHTMDGDVMNDVVPFGKGSGILALTLRTLYNANGEVAQGDGSFMSGPVSFAGFNPIYPIYRRPSSSGGSPDGFDYFLQDKVSIALNDVYQQPLPPADIGPVVNAAGGISPADMLAAATALYQWGVSKLQWGAQQQETISLVTTGYFDAREVAGNQVHVYVAHYLPDGTAQVKVNLFPQVLACEVSWDNTTGNPRYTWQLSTNGMQGTSGAQGIANAVVSNAQLITQYGNKVDIVATPIYRSKSQNVGPGADLVMNIRADNGSVNTHYAVGFITLEGMVHTRADPGHAHDVQTAEMPHNVATQSVDVAPTAKAENVIIASQPFDLGIGVTGSNSDTTNPLYFRRISGLGTLWKPSSGNDSIGIAGQIYGADTLHGHPVTKTGLGASTPETTDGTGGKVPAAKHVASSGDGALSTEATVEEVYRGPSPKNVTVLVDNVERAGPFSTAASFDLTAWLSDQNFHEVRVKSPDNGMVELEIDMLRDRTLIAITPPR